MTLMNFFIFGQTDNILGFAKLSSNHYTSLQGYILQPTFHRRREQDDVFIQEFSIFHQCQWAVISFLKCNIKSSR